MSAPKDTGNDFDDVDRDSPGPPPRKIKVDEVLRDLRAGLRTQQFLSKYGITLSQFEELLKKLIRQGLFTKEEFRAWKSNRPAPKPEPEYDFQAKEAGQAVLENTPDNIATYILREPEKNHAWALQLFSTRREAMKGAQFKVNLHGRKYSFFVEELIFRGQVDMLEERESSKGDTRGKREEALAFIARHGWAAYLESRAIAANVETTLQKSGQKARLVLLHCRNETFLAALHTPAPAINLYVGNSLARIRSRLAKSIDTSVLQP